MIIANENLKKLREARGVSQQRMAEFMTIHFGTPYQRNDYGNIENQRKAPTIEEAQYLADLYRVRLDEIFSKKEEVTQSMDS